MLLIVYFMTGLNPSAGAFFVLLLVCMSVALAGEGLSQAISVFAGDEQAAAAVVPVFVILQVLFGGFFIPPDALPDYIAWGRYLSFIYYGFNTAVLNEFVGRGVSVMDSGRTVNIDEVIVEELKAPGGKWTNLGILLGFVAVFKGFYFLMLVLSRPKFDRKL